MPSRPPIPRRAGLRIGAFATFVLGAVVGLLPRAANATDPADRGPLEVATWDAGTLELGAARIRTRVYYPGDAGVYPLVALLHGANGDGTYHPELASTLASRGLVVLVPDMPCTVISCDHDRNADTVLAMLQWAIDRSAGADAPISGRVDAERRGLIGHSWGGLTVHLAAARNDSIRSLVLLDPNDDGTEGRDASAGIDAPTLQLIAETEGACNSAWREAMVREALIGPNLQVTLGGSGHCDPGERDVLCSIACGSGRTPSTETFRRYAVAWTTCNLLGDEEMATWIGGDSFDDDVRSGVLTNVAGERLEELPCIAGVRPDPEPDAGSGDAGPSDAGPDADPVDAGLDPGIDAGPDVPLDTALPPDTEDSGNDTSIATDVSVSETSGAHSDASPDSSRDLPDPSSPEGCSAASGAPGFGAAWWAALLLRSTRRRPVRPTSIGRDMP